MKQDRLWLLISHLERPDVHLAIPTVAWIARKAGVEFECYLESERSGRLFARTGSTVLGGRHHQQFNYLNAAFDVEVILLGPTSVFRSSIDAFGTPLLTETDSLIDLYEILLAEAGLDDADHRLLFGPVDPVEGKAGPIEIGPYLFPDIFYREALAFPASSLDEAADLATERPLEAVHQLFLSLTQKKEVLSAFPQADQIDAVREEDTIGTVTLRIAERWKHRAEGVAFGDPPAILSQLSSLCRESRIAVYAPKEKLNPSDVVYSAYTEETSAISDDVVRLAEEVGNRVLVGRQTGDGDLFAWSKSGVCLQIMDPNRPPFPVVKTVAHRWAEPERDLFDLEPDDAQLRRYAEEGKLLSTLLWHSGEMAHNEAMVNLLDLVSYTGVKMGIGVHAARYETCPQLWEMLNVPRERGGVQGLIEPLLHSGGMGVLAEVGCPPHLLQEHCEEAMSRIRALAGEGSAPRGYYAFMDTDLPTRSVINEEGYEAIEASGLEYVVSSVSPGRNRIIWETDRCVVFNQSCRVIHSASPFVRITTLEDIVETGNRDGPGWLIGTLDAPVIAFDPYIWRHGSRFMRIVDWLKSDEVVNVTPRTIARYARILRETGALPAPEPGDS